jgi:hypothetical protein
VATVIVLVALAVNFGGLVVGWLSLRQHQKDLAAGQKEIHVMVNSNLSKALARGVQLADTLKDAGIAVPPPVPPEKTLIPPAGG